MNIIANEMIFVPDGNVTGASDCILLEEGRIFAAWEEEACGSVVIMGAVRDAKGKWEPKRQLTLPDGTNRRSPVLNRTKDGIMLLYVSSGSFGGCSADYMISEDGCRTFGAEKVLIPGGSGDGAVLNGRFLTLANGTILAGGSSTAGERVSYIWRSEDGGSVWQKSGALKIPEMCRAGREGLEVFGIMNPALFSEGGEYVHALMQSTAGYVFRADSEDGGKTWNSLYPLNVANPNSRLNVVSLQGAQYMICNPAGLPEGKAEGKHTPLSVMLSTTGGSNWKKVTALATGAGDFSSPSIRCEAGKMYITYTWNKATVQFVIIELQ